MSGISGFVDISSLVPPSVDSANRGSGRGEEPSGEKVLRLIQTRLATPSFERIPQACQDNPLCIYVPASLSVRLNMIEPNNGHAPTTSANKYTGAIILRTRPHTYKRVVRLLSEGVPAIRIARACKVTERSVAAIAKREREEITERKKSLACLMSNIAGIGGATVERKIGKASVRDAIIGTGVAIDKMIALTSQTPAINIVNFPIPSAEERAEMTAIDRKLDAIAAKLKAAQLH